MTIAAIALGVLVLANLVAAIPGRQAARTKRRCCARRITRWALSGRGPSGTWRDDVDLRHDDAHRRRDRNQAGALGSTRTTPTRCCGSPAIAAHESGERQRPPVSCHVLGRAVALGTPLDVLARVVEGGAECTSTLRSRRAPSLPSRSTASEYVVWRGASGALGARRASCPHLDHDLAEGFVVGDELVCPGHGWAFDGHGNMCKRNEFGRVDPKGTVPASPCAKTPDRIDAETVEAK